MILWPESDRWRAPVNDFPPPWASAWGDDRFGLWADLRINGVTQRMRWIEPSGEEGFLMGAPQAERDAIAEQNIRQWANDSEHEPLNVVIRQGFWLADTPCTQAFWQVVQGNNPSHFQNLAQAALCPVEQVNWDHVQGFLNRLSAEHSWCIGNRAMLPTEVQWEYAARAGTNTAYWWGNTLDPARANIDCNDQKLWSDKDGTSPVDRYLPNRWGLYDMLGNVWEWCADAWRSRLDQPGDKPDESSRVVRGGSWISLPGYVRSAYRGWRLREHIHHNQGFRLALRSPDQSSEG